MNRRGVYDLISVLGAIVLFSAWIFQQTSVEKQGAVISRLEQAEAEYRQYQSSNALFNALIETEKGNDAVIEGIRRFQMYNYGLGLVRLSKVTGLSPVVGYDVPMDEMQNHLQTVQSAADAMKQDAQQRKDRNDFIFLIAYGAGSALALFGSIMKLTAPA